MFNIVVPGSNCKQSHVFRSCAARHPVDLAVTSSQLLSGQLDSALKGIETVDNRRAGAKCEVGGVFPQLSNWRGIYFRCVFFFSLLASWLLGFSAVGGFLALTFRILCFPSSSPGFCPFHWPASSASPVPPYLNQRTPHFFERPISRENAAKNTIF